MTISANIARVLSSLGIQGVKVFDESRPDRVFAWDVEREMAVQCLINKQHWMLDRWDPLHGRSTRDSFRERTRPSMQVCFHEISQVNTPGTDWYFLEIDFDEAPPSNPLTILIHGKEVIVNAITHGFTDQDRISVGLDARLKGTNGQYTEQAPLSA